MKKAQSISINTIIIAAIALAVLVVLFMVFTGRISIFGEGLSGATSCSQQCTAIGKTSAGSVDEGQTCTSGVALPGGIEMVGGVKKSCCCS